MFIISYHYAIVLPQLPDLVGQSSNHSRLVEEYDDLIILLDLLYH